MKKNERRNNINVRGIFFVAVLVVGLFIASQGIAVAQEKASFSPSISLKDNLAFDVGKRVSLMISSGESLKGTIEKVGDHFVLISKLSGKDYFDALVRIDELKAVVFRAR